MLRICTDDAIACLQIIGDWSKTFRLDDANLHFQPGDLFITAHPLLSNEAHFDGTTGPLGMQALQPGQMLPRGTFIMTMGVAALDDRTEVDAVSGAVLGSVCNQPFQIGFHVDGCRPFTNCGARCTRCRPAADE